MPWPTTYFFETRSSSLLFGPYRSVQVLLAVPKLRPQHRCFSSATDAEDMQNLLDISLYRGLAQVRSPGLRRLGGQS